MTDTTQTPPAAPAPLSGDSASQTTTALRIIYGLVILGLSLVVAAAVTGQWAIVIGPVGTILGILGTALNAPSGIGNVLAAARGASTTVTSPRQPS